jgi:hypothetical protein
VGENGYISYDAYKTAIEQVRRSGVAPRIALPFAARPGQIVNIGGAEYRLGQPVDSEAAVSVAATGPADAVGYQVTKL